MKSHVSAIVTLVVIASMQHSFVDAWGGLFNRFTPEMLTNLGYGGHRSYLDRQSYLQVSWHKHCIQSFFIHEYTLIHINLAWYTAVHSCSRRAINIRHFYFFSTTFLERSYVIYSSETFFVLPSTLSSWEIKHLKKGNKNLYIYIYIYIYIYMYIMRERCGAWWREVDTQRVVTESQLTLKKTHLPRSTVALTNCILMNNWIFYELLTLTSVKK